MMRPAKILLLIGLAGSIFAGYLAYSSIFAKVCPFNEACLYLWGYPTCLYGFVMFLAIFILSLFAMAHKPRKCHCIRSIAIVSILGALFAGYYAVKETLPCFDIGCKLVLPACAYGLVFFIAAAIISLKGNR